MTGEAKYFISVGGVERGPYTLAVLRDVAKKGLVTPDTVCRADGATTTITAGELLGLKPAPAPAPAPAAAAKQYAIKFQPHNPFRFTGKGSAQVRGRELVLDGKRARPFWFSKKTQVAVPLEGIRDSHTKGKSVVFGVPGKRGVQATLSLSFDDEAQAAAFAAALPQTLSQEAKDLVEFATRLTAKSSGSPVAWVLLAINVAIYVAFGYMGGGFGRADGEMLVRWGSNFGPLTTGGEWWRLLSAAFLHGGFVHIAVNMYTLYDFGRLSERLFGSGRFALIYLLSALLGSAASVWWNPMVNSVGASGALFGVLGASLVYMLDKRNGVPVSVMNAHAASLGVFIVYAIFNGLTKSGIDNAAHLGGFAAGLIAGFALARPLGDGPAPGFARRAAGVALCTAAILGLAWLTPNTSASYELERRFIADLKWLGDQEKALNASANEVFAKAKAGAADAEIEPKVKAIATGWNGVHARLSSYKIEPPSRLSGLHADVAAYASARSRAFATMTRVFEDPQQSKLHMEEYARLMKEADAAVARINARNGQKKG